MSTLFVNKDGKLCKHQFYGDMLVKAIADINGQITYYLIPL